MKKFFTSIWLFIKASTWFKYALVTVFAVVFIGFVDENSVWNHFRNKQTISDLQKRRADNIIWTCAGDYSFAPDFKAYDARYYMKADDEDIFVLSDDMKQEEEE